MSAWDDLESAIKLLRKHNTDEVSPFHCEHDTLRVMSDPTKYDGLELEQLEQWGFHFDDEDCGGFYSFRFGSA